MPNNKENRVLSRMGARQLTKSELDRITGSGGGGFTHASHIPTSPVSNPDVGFDS